MKLNNKSQMKRSNGSNTSISHIIWTKICWNVE